jgi:ferric-dicitrate binding protein FerR (iron transport regulator)
MGTERADDERTDFETLALLHLDGCADDAQRADFAHLLATVADAPARLARIAELHAQLLETGRASSHHQLHGRDSSGRRAALSAGSHRRRRSAHAPGRPWRVAGLLTLVVTVVVTARLLVPEAAPAMTMTMTMLSVTDGKVSIERAGRRTEVNGRSAIHPGDRIHTATGAHAAITTRDGSRIEVAPGSHLVWPEEAEPLQLNTGAFTADIVARPPERPFLAETPEAEVTVLGTRFTLQADDGLSLLAVERGRVRLGNRRDHHQVEVASAEMAGSSGSGVMTTSPASLAFAAGSPTATGALHGLTGDYYDGIDFSDWRLRRLDPQIDFDWGYEPPDPRLERETFSIRWRGYIVPAHSGEYTFSLKIDDGARLWIDGRLVIDEWHLSERLEFSGRIALEAGRPYPIRIDFYQQPYLAMVSLRWALPGRPATVVPGSWLRPPEWQPPSK